MSRLVPWFVSLLAACSLTGCGADQGATRIAVWRVDPQGGEIPLPGARVRAVALDTSPVPLPLSAKTISDALDNPDEFRSTDDAGIARLSLKPDYAYLIEVVPPPFDAPAARQGLLWRWTLVPGEPHLLEDPSEPNPPGVTARVMD